MAMVPSQPFGPGSASSPLMDSETGEPMGASGGLSPGAMAGLGLGSYLLGSGLSYMGQRQGAKALEEEARRQAAEQEAFSQQRHDLILKALGQINPAERPALAQVATQRRIGATAPALAAGGKALGLSGSQVAGAGRAIFPAQRVRAQNEAVGVRDTRQGFRDAELGMDLGDLDQRRGMASALYEDQLGLAGFTGQGLRTIGAGFQSGLPLVGMAMGQPADPNPGAPGAVVDAVPNEGPVGPARYEPVWDSPMLTNSALYKAPKRRARPFALPAEGTMEGITF